MSGLENCGNCGRLIGKLEQANVWKEHVVCPDCWGNLTRGAPAARQAGSPRAVVSPPPLPAKSSAKRTGQPGYDVADSRGATIAPGYLLKCGRCGGSYGLSEVSNEDGRITCRACVRAEAAERAAAEASAVARAATEVVAAARNPWLVTVGVAALVIAVGVGAFVYFFDRAGGGGKPAASKSVARSDPRSDARDVNERAASLRDANARDAMAQNALAQNATAQNATARDAVTPDVNSRLSNARGALDRGTDGRLMDLMLDAAQFEAAGKPDQARVQYHTVIAIVQMRRDATPEQQKVAGRARDAITRLEAARVAGGAGPNPGASPAPPVEPPTLNATAAAPPLDDGLVADVGPSGESGAASPTEKAKTARTPDADRAAGAGPSGDPGSISANPSGESPASSGLGPEIDRGRDALAAGQYAAALDVFKAAMSVDKKSPHAHHGLGLAYHGLGQPAKAVESLEKAASLGANRAIVHNLAVVHMKDNPMRAAKFVREFLAKPATPLDEPLQNVLGLAMVSANDEARAGAVYADLRKFYMEYDHRLAVARADGNKRWGAKWIRAEDADVRWARSKESAEALARAKRDAGRASVRTKKAYQAGRDIATSLRLHREREKRAAAARYRAAIKDEQEAKKRYATARSVAGSTEQPQFPTYLRVIPIDALDPLRHPK